MVIALLGFFLWIRNFSEIKKMQLIIENEASLIDEWEVITTNV